jgi:hypothetical protein
MLLLETKQTVLGTGYTTECAACQKQSKDFDNALDLCLQCYFLHLTEPDEEIDLEVESVLDSAIDEMMARENKKICETSKDLQ